jgi:Beta/Gamma crystallin
MTQPPHRATGHHRRHSHAPRSLALAAVLLGLVGAVAAAGIELFDAPGLGGERLSLEGEAFDLADFGFKDRTRSLVVRKGHWEVCERPQFRGTCLTLAVGTYETLPTALAARIGSVRPLAAMAVAPTVGAGPAAVTPEATALTLYRDAGLAGRRVAVDGAVPNLGGLDFNDEATSVDVRRGRWQLCIDADFGAPCLVLGPGRHELSGRFQDGVTSLRPVFGPQDQPLPASGGVVLYEDIDFNGRELLRLEPTRDLSAFSFNDRVSSIEVLAGRWELCSDAEFGGRCTVFGPGRHRLDGSLGDRVSSLRPR